MKRIAVVTATRAEYGLLTPLIRRINSDAELELNLIVTGTHLSEKNGHTIDEIKKDGFSIAHEIAILDEDNSPYGISVTMANAIKGFAECFKDDRPNMVVILGDRTELLGVASAALNERIPIAHIHGGEVTEGAVDDCVRHALTKMSYLHFTSTEVYRQRVIQMGENPERVFNVGALGAENILTQNLMTCYELAESLKDLFEVEILEDNYSQSITQWLLYGRYAVMTYHPVTLEESSYIQISELCEAMATRSDIFFLITAANADAGGNEVNRLLKEYCDSHDNAFFAYNLGMKRYLSAVKHSLFAIGNSSSGLIEAPVLGTPTVNIGNRQKGRLIPETVINCEPEKNRILEAIAVAECMEHRGSNLYGDVHTSENIIKVIRKSLNKEIELKKRFYDNLPC